MEIIYTISTHRPTKIIFPTEEFVGNSEENLITDTSSIKLDHEHYVHILYETDKPEETLEHYEELFRNKNNQAEDELRFHTVEINDLYLVRELMGMRRFQLGQYGVTRYEDLPEEESMGVRFYMLDLTQGKIQNKSNAELEVIYNQLYAILQLSKIVGIHIIILSSPHYTHEKIFDLLDIKIRDFHDEILVATKPTTPFVINNIKDISRSDSK